MRQLFHLFAQAFHGFLRSDMLRYEHNQWFKDIIARYDRYRYWFLLCALSVALFIPPFLAFAEIRDQSYSSLWWIAVSEAGVFAAFAYLLFSKQEKTISRVVLVFMPLAYLLASFAPNTHGLQVLLLIILPLFVINLSFRNRSIARWILYYYAVIALGALLPLLGLPNNWLPNYGMGSMIIFYAANIIVFLSGLVYKASMLGILYDTIDRFLRDKASGFPTMHVFHEDLGEQGRSVVGILRVGNFKELAILFGYEFSEAVLVEAAAKLKKALDPLGASAYRLHGYDFGFLIPLDDEGEEACSCMVIDIFNTLKGSISWHGKRIEPVYHIGYSIAEGGIVDRCLTEADLALKWGIEERESVVAYSEELDDRNNMERMTEKLLLLSRNIKEGRLAAYHQRIVSLESEHSIWKESLLRVWDFCSAYEAPGAFLPLLHSTGYDREVSDFMVTHAEDFLAHSPCWLSINVSSRDLCRPAFMERANRLAADAWERGGRFILELLESDLMTSHESVIPALSEFRLSGGLVAMDDFGSGFSNFGKLLSVPLDIVKFDGDFVRMAYVDATARALLARVAQTLSCAGITTVAEYIETDDQAVMLRKLGIDYGQGYLWGRPEPCAAVNGAEGGNTGSNALY